MSFDDLRGLASSQFGLFTTAQATKLEVGRSKLHSLLQKNELRLVRRGVYAFDIFAPDANEELRAAWLSLDPGKTVAERLRDDQCAVVATTSAAYLHGLGNFATYSHEFFVPIRKQSRAEDVHIRVRTLSPSDVEVVEGMRVTSVTRTVLDLLADGEELEHISDFLADAARENKSIDWKRIREESPRYQKVYGVPGESIFAMVVGAVSVDDLPEDYAMSVISSISPETKKMINEQLRSIVQQITLPKIDVPKISIPQETLHAIAASQQQVQNIFTERLTPLFEQQRQLQKTFENMLSAQKQSLGKISQLELEEEIDE